MAQQNYFTINAGRAKRGVPVLDSQPGAHTGASRKYIPGYTDSLIIYLDTVSGNDGNAGTAEGAPKLTYASAATAAGSTKKIRVINNGAALSVNITKPTEMKRGLSGEITSDPETAFDTWGSATAAWLAGHATKRALWVPELAKFFVVGGTASSKLGYSSNGTSFTEATTTFGTSVIYDIFYAPDLALLCAVGADGKIETSPDGVTWTARSSGVSTIITSITYSKNNALFIAAGMSSVILISDNGITWVVASGIAQNIIDANNAIMCLFEKDGTIYAGTSAGQIYYSLDGNAWTKATTPEADTIFDISYGAGTFLASINSAINPAYFSTDGIIWTATAGIKASNEQCIFIPELGWFVSANGTSAVFYSEDGTTWIDASPSPSVTSGVAYSPTLGILIGTGDGVIKYCTLSSITVSAPIAGFTVNSVLYSGTITLYNCTMKAFTTINSLNMDSCRITQPNTSIVNNTQSHIANLFEYSFSITCTPSALNSIDINLNTIGGTLFIYNASATGFERFRDNIAEGGIQATYAVIVTSGNTRGTSTNATFSEDCTQSDPKFVDTTDYKLQREIDLYQYDSPLVAASTFYLNNNGDARDIGAWSYNESTMELLYTRHFPFILPNAKDAFSVVLHTRVNRHIGEDGTPDCDNDTDYPWEEITLRYGSLPSDHIEFIDWWQLNFSDMSCELDFFVSEEVSTTVTVNGNQSALSPTLTIDAGSTLGGGDRLTIGTEYYSVLYMVGDTIAILSKPLVASVLDNAVITVSQPTGLGVYQFLPPADRDLKKPFNTASDDYERGLVLNFSRKKN